MDEMTITSKRGAELAANDILKAFGYRNKVTLRWSGRTRNGYAYNSGIISIGPNVWRGVEQTLVHEVSHLLAPHAAPHDYKFFTVLAKVAKYRFGDVREYDWATEYKRIHTWARKEGWTV